MSIEKNINILYTNCTAFELAMIYKNIVNNVLDGV